MTFWPVCSHFSPIFRLDFKLREWQTSCCLLVLCSLYMASMPSQQELLRIPRSKKNRGLQRMLLRLCASEFGLAFNTTIKYFDIITKYKFFCFLLNKICLYSCKKAVGKVLCVQRDKNQLVNSAYKYFELFRFCSFQFQNKESRRIR